MKHTTDFKFVMDPYEIKLSGLLTPEQYAEAIENLNKKLRPCRAGAIDATLLATGPLLVPLVLWGVRHRSQTKKRKRLLKEGIHEFNVQYPELLMRWNRRPAQSMLIIERRVCQSSVDATSLDQNVAYSTFDGTGGEQQEVMHMVQARLVPNSGIASSGPLHHHNHQQHVYHP
mmetsp:Transcript_6939/g.14745  ORF Transcript_6939/g.14745 Transcript_6939/m.14745 type:complete len:173 (+) Transcript_6939:470-988(+)